MQNILFVSLTETLVHEVVPVTRILLEYVVAKSSTSMHIKRIEVACLCILVFICYCFSRPCSTFGNHKYYTTICVYCVTGITDGADCRPILHSKNHNSLPAFVLDQLHCA